MLLSRVTVPPANIWQHLQTLSVVSVGEGDAAGISIEGTETRDAAKHAQNSLLLHPPPPRAANTHNRPIRLHMSTAPRLRSPGLGRLRVHTPGYVNVYRLHCCRRWFSKCKPCSSECGQGGKKFSTPSLYQAGGSQRPRPADGDRPQALLLRNRWPCLGTADHISAPGSQLAGCCLRH